MLELLAKRRQSPYRRGRTGVSLHFSLRWPDWPEQDCLLMSKTPTSPARTTVRGGARHAATGDVRNARDLPTGLPTDLPTDLPSDLPPNAGRAAAGIAIVLVAQLMLILDATVVNVALPHIDD